MKWHHKGLQNPYSAFESLQTCKYGNLFLDIMLISNLVKITAAFVIFHLLLYMVLYPLSWIYDGPLSVGIPMKVYTLSCGLPPALPDCQSKTFYAQNLIIDLIIWVLIGMLIRYFLKIKIFKKV